MVNAVRVRGTSRRLCFQQLKTGQPIVPIDSGTKTELGESEQVVGKGVDMLQCDVCDFRCIDKQEILEHKYKKHMYDKCPEEKCSFSSFDENILKARFFC